jgi:hypothetical protein
MRIIFTVQRWRVSVHREPEPRLFPAMPLRYMEGELEVARNAVQANERHRMALEAILASSNINAHDIAAAALNTRRARQEF